MKKLLLYIMALLYVAAGINHFVHPAFYIKIMPHWLPVNSWGALVLISGVCEVLFALLLIPVSTRVVGAWLMIALLIAVFPANIQMFLDYLHANSPKLWITIVRMPLQGVLIWWAAIYTKQE